MTRRLAQTSAEPEVATLVPKVDSRPSGRCPQCDRLLADRHHCEFFYE